MTVAKLVQKSSVAVGHYLPVRFASLVAASATLTLQYPIEFNGRITSMRFRVYLGNQLSLQVTPSLIHNDAAQVLIRTVAGGDTYLVGDDEQDSYQLATAFVSGDVLQVQAVNTNATYGYHFAVDFELLREA